MDNKTIVSLSKKLSLVLRHKAPSLKLNIGSDGYVRLDELLALPIFKGYTEDNIHTVVEGNDKQRFSIILRNDMPHIRANQGHSFQVPDLELKPILSESDVPYVIHGTTFKNFEKIKRSEGLCTMGRTYIHFAKGYPGEVKSGLRWNSEVLIHIDLKAALEEGYLFFESANEVILCPGKLGLNQKGWLPKHLFSKVTDRAGTKQHM
eukprot:GCRY01003084.1.p1 GENE.GCRY01003084.1~~GCRY01003084.1.p1  ORF type:complete len:206 (-),score=11.88 GCRY01003084.1:249-866(-)